MIKNRRCHTSLIINSYVIIRDVLVQLHIFDYYVKTRRGLSRPDDHLASVTPEDSFFHTGLQTTLQSVKEALSSYNDTPSSSGRSSPTSEETQSTESAQTVRYPCNIGNTTGRSSIDSSDDSSDTYALDEFDRQAARSVKHLFDEIDGVLYCENRQPLELPSKEIFKECQEWSSQFPHIRILGQQLISPQETGYQLIEREGSRPSTGNLLLDVTEQDYTPSQDFQGLSVAGQHITAVKPPMTTRASDSSKPLPPEYSHLEEEIFEEDGHYEDIIAIDYKDIYDDTSDQKKTITPRRRRIGYPPISPNACVKDSVASQAFDCMWAEVISWLRVVVHRQCSFDGLKSPTRTPSSLLPPSREISFITQSKLYMPRPQTINFETTGMNSLDDLLKISSKKLQVREKSDLQDTPEPTLPQTRPGSSFPKNPNRPTSVRYPQRPGFQRGKLLAPIPLNDRSRTPSVEDSSNIHVGSDALLRVTRITPHGNDRLSSPPQQLLHRNGALPPLLGIDYETGSPLQRPIRRTGLNRASSAVDKDVRIPNRDRYTTPIDPRPSTTHTMRTDPPFGAGRRSSTPLGIMIPRSSSHMMHITGSSLQHHSDHLSHIPSEEHEGSIVDVIHNQLQPSISPPKYMGNF